MRLLDRLRLWWTGKRLQEHLSAIEERCLDAEVRKQKALIRLAAREAEIGRLYEQMLASKAMAEKELAAAKSAFDAYEESLSAVRAELRVAADITVPALVASHKLLLARYDAETTIETRRGVSAMLPRE